MRSARPLGDLVRHAVLVAVAATAATLAAPTPSAAQVVTGPPVLTSPWFGLQSNIVEIDPGDVLNDRPPTYVPGAPSTLEFTLNTAAGTNYAINFDWLVFPAYFGAATFNVSWAGTSILTFNGQNGGGTFAHFLVGQGGDAVLRFEHSLQAGSSCSAYICDDWGSRATVDNLVVSPILATPEPSTYVLMATGLVALGGVAARRRRAIS